MIPIRLHIPGLFFLSFLTITPVALSIAKDGQSQKASTDRLASQEAVTAQDTKVGLIRAKTCQIITPKTPISTDSAPVVYDGTDRRIPIGSPICDRNGYTALQGDTGVLDIRPINPITLSNALKGR